MTRPGSRLPRGVRFREDVGFEMRCDSCATSGGTRYWPMTTEFWWPTHGLSKCRACHQHDEARKLREKRVADPAFQARIYARNAKYRAEARAAQRVKDQQKWQRIQSDPILLARARERSRESSRRYKAKQRAEKAA